MTAGSSEIMSKVRALKARALSFEDYSTEIRGLVAIGAIDLDADLEAVDAAFRFRSLQRRLANLERRVAALGVQK